MTPEIRCRWISGSLGGMRTECTKTAIRFWNSRAYKIQFGYCKAHAEKAVNENILPSNSEEITREEYVCKGIMEQ